MYAEVFRIQEFMIEYYKIFLNLFIQFSIFYVINSVEILMLQNKSSNYIEVLVPTLYFLHVLYAKK